MRRPPANMAQNLGRGSSGPLARLTSRLFSAVLRAVAWATSSQLHPQQRALFDRDDPDLRAHWAIGTSDAPGTVADANAAGATNDRLIEKEICANHRVRPALGEQT
jgi:hypothetical protein